MSTENSNQDEKKGGKKTAGIVCLVAVILILIAVIVYLLWPRKPEENELRNMVVTPDNVQEAMDQMQQQTPVEAGYYTVTMNYEWNFATGDAVSPNAYVENTADNTHAVYFDMFLAEDEENAIYKSPVIPVGSSLQGIALDTDLDAGTYDCIVVYHLIDDEQNTLSTLRVTVTAIVEG